MVKTELIDGLKFTYAPKTTAEDDKEPYYMIRQTDTGALYESAFDTIDTQHVYMSTEIVIENK